MPESVRFSLDIRAPADGTVEALGTQIVVDFEKIAAGESVGSLNELVILAILAKTVTASINAFKPKLVKCYFTRKDGRAVSKSRRIAFPLLSGFIRTASKPSLKLRRQRLG